LKPGDYIIFDSEVERVECVYKSVIVHAIKRVAARRFEARTKVERIGDGE